MQPKRDRNFLEAFLQNAEAGVDLLTDNEAVRAVPVIGTAFKLCKGLDDLRSKILAAKLRRFLSDPNLQSESARDKIKRKILEDEDQASAVGEALFLVLDRLTDLDKPTVLAKAYVAYLDDLMSSTDLRRMAQAIDLAFADDLLAFLESDQLHLHDDTKPWMTLLESTGLTSSTVNRAPPGLARTSRSVTAVGHSLWKAWRYAPTET